MHGTVKKTVKVEFVVLFFVIQKHACDFYGICCKDEQERSTEKCICNERTKKEQKKKLLLLL